MKTARLPRSKSRIPCKEEFSPCNVLVPLDFSTLSTAALNKGKQIAQQFGSKLHLIHAVELVTHHVDFILVPPEMEDVNQRFLAARKTRLESLRREITAAGVECLAEARFGSPWRTIVDYAKRAKCDLIVIPTHGHTGPKHLLLGSTAERVVQHAPCSVLVVR